MSLPIAVKWTARSLRNARSIRSYLVLKFSAKEVASFEKLLEDLEQTVLLFPKLYPSSKTYPNLRKAVLHKYTSVFYSFKKNEIVVVAMQDNRQLEPK